MNKSEDRGKKEDKINFARRRNCTLVITHSCNLNCVYCYETHKDDSSMPLELAKEIITKEFEFVKNSPDFDEIEFDFMGGEPFVKFDLMKEIMNWTWSQNRDVPYIFFATTNGTLITDEIKRWLYCHRKYFVLGISYDGTDDSQDMNRTNSAGKVDIDFFLKTYPNQGVKMTISPASLKNLAEGVIRISEKGIKLSANCGYGQVWSEEDKDEFHRQLMILADYYLAHPDIEPIPMFDRKFRFLNDKRDAKQKWCGTGTHMITYDVDGTTYPCHLFTPMVLGCQKAAELQNKMDFASGNVNTDPFCEDCSLLNICPTCYGFNYRDTGNIATREKTMCELFRIQTSVLVYYVQELLRKKKEANIPFDRGDRLDAEGLLFLKDHLPKIKES